MLNKGWGESQYKNKYFTCCYFIFSYLVLKPINIILTIYIMCMWINERKRQLCPRRIAWSAPNMLRHCIAIRREYTRHGRLILSYIPTIPQYVYTIYIDAGYMCWNTNFSAFLFHYKFSFFPYNWSSLMEFWFYLWSTFSTRYLSNVSLSVW